MTPPCLQIKHLKNCLNWSHWQATLVWIRPTLFYLTKLIHDVSKPTHIYEFFQSQVFHFAAYHINVCKEWHMIKHMWTHIHLTYIWLEMFPNILILFLLQKHTFSFTKTYVTYRKNIYPNYKNKDFTSPNMYYIDNKKTKRQLMIQDNGRIQFLLKTLTLSTQSRLLTT